jgi:hypothetical protein
MNMPQKRVRYDDSESECHTLSVRNPYNKSGLNYQANQLVSSHKYESCFRAVLNFDDIFGGNFKVAMKLSLPFSTAR